MRILALIALALLMSACTDDSQTAVPAAEAKAATPAVAPWSDMEAQLQGQTVVSLIKRGEKDLAVGIETGDAEGINSRITAPFAKVLHDWNGQRDINNAAAEKFGACHDAAFHFQFYALSFTTQDSINNREGRALDLREYKKYRDACAALVKVH